MRPLRLAVLALVLSVAAACSEATAPSHDGPTYCKDGSLMGSAGCPG